MTEFVIDRALLTDVGRKHRHNEDAVGYYEPTGAEELASSGRLYIVADGVGGAAAGEVASQYAVEKVLYEYYRSDEPDPGARLAAAIRATHADLYEHAERNPEGRRMGTTLVAAVVHGTRLIVGNVGDSRAYLIRSGEIRQITRDHSLVAQLVEEGSITAKEAQTHPRRNVLLRCLGIDPSVRPDIFEEQLRLGDHVLLCSDGLTRHVSDEEMLNLARRTGAERAVEKLVELANARGGKDNISADLLHCTEKVDLATLAGREAGREELVAPTLDGFEAKAYQRRLVGGARAEKRRRPWPPRARVWLALGVVGGLIALGGTWLIQHDLVAGLLRAGLALGGAALLLVLAKARLNR